MPEEVVLLVEKGKLVHHRVNFCWFGLPSITGLALLVDDKNAHHDPSAPALNKWDGERLRLVERQLALAEEHEAKEALNPDRAMSEKAILKRKEREEKRACLQFDAAETSQEISEESLFVNDSNPNPNLDGHPESSRAESSHKSSVTVPPQASTSPYTIQVPGASSMFEWYDQSAHSFSTLAAARKAGIWDYPETPAEHARCGVFRDLWEQGYFMGGGIKFGGEYLVYPGTSALSYSTFILHLSVITWYHELG
jgi:tRNA-splicing endonuclease subunit Sen34